MSAVAAARARRRSQASVTHPRLGAGGMLGLIILGGFGLLPTYWLVATAFTKRTDVFAGTRSLVPLSPTLGNFQELAQNSGLVHDLVNSVVISVGTALLSVAVSTLMAYSLSKFRYRGRNALMALLLAGQLFPGALLLIALYLMLNSLGLIYTYPGVILSFTTFTLPLTVFLLKGFFDALPSELIEAARMDGASHLIIVTRIIAPLAVPGILTAGLFAFMRAWNDLLFALTLAGPDKQTLPAGLVESFIHDGSSDWPGLMAASLVTSLPVVIVFVILQRHFVSGLAAGAVRG